MKRFVNGMFSSISDAELTINSMAREDEPVDDANEAAPTPASQDSTRSAVDHESQG